ncbi:MAG: hypothetical protein IJS65_05755 [Clostridia bacterium]|nr:hypothetical protein [Clostridia bacterium]
MTDRTEKMKKFYRRAGVLALICVLALGGSVYAWLNARRRVAAVAEIDSPVAIYINAAHKEDIQYLDLSEIDMERERPDGSRYNYQDFIFTVQGEEVALFKLQLAYTTNNQLQFEIYEATEGAQGANSVVYYSPTGSAYYYDPDGGAIPMTYLNTQSGDLLADSSMHTDTYGSYSNVNTYAEPIYCQSTNAIAARNREGINFHNYFILRVKWTNGKMNDRETDILYLSAKAGA